MNGTASELNKEVVFEVNGWAIIHEIGLYRTRFGIAVRREDRTAEEFDPDGHVLYGYYGDPLSHLLTRFDSELLGELVLALGKDAPREGEDRDTAWEDRALHIENLKREATGHGYVPLSFAEANAVKVFESYGAGTGRRNRPVRI